MIPVTLRTERLELSTPTAADVDAIFEICQDPEVQRWTTVPSPYRREHAAGFVERVVAPGWDEGRETTWALRLAGELIGVVALLDIEDGAGALGYWMSPAHRRRGLLYEAFGSYLIVWWLSVALGIVSALINLPIVEKPVERAAPQPA